MTRLLPLLLLPLVVSANDLPPAKVLVYSIRSGFSHVNFMGRVSDILAESGMNVTTLVSILRDDVGDGTTKSRVIHIDADPTAFAEWNTDSDHMSEMFRGASDEVTGIVGMAGPMTETFARQCKHALTKTDLLEQLKNEKFDAMLTENFDYCGFGLAKVIGAKSVITVSSASMSDYLSWVTGTPMPLSWMQSSFSAGVDQSISSRIGNLVSFAANYYMNSKMAAGITDAFKERFGPDFPAVEEIIASSSLIITAADPLVDMARPTLRKVIDIGAIGVRDSKPIDEEYNELLNLRPRTVILSFGSVAKSVALPSEYKTAIAEAFRRFPDVTFLWKYEEPENAKHVEGISNIIVKKWMPQNDLLGDPRISAFISHGGKTSLNEVGDKGVPVIMVPLFADQPRNAAIAQKLGFGFIFEKNDLANADKIEAALREILDNEKYAAAAKRVAATIRARPFSARELLVRHVDFAARFGNVVALDNEGFDYPLYIYWNLDLVAVALLVIVSSAVLLFYCIRKLFCASKKPVSSKKKRN